MKTTWAVWAFAMAVFAIAGCTHEPFADNLPGSGGGGSTGTDILCFETEVLPIFISNCAKSGCHNSSSAEDGYVLTDYSHIVRKGIKPKNSNDSKIYEVLLETGSDRMPPAPNPPLSTAQIALIKKWIDQGATNTTNCNTTTTCNTQNITYMAIVNPIIQNNCVGCHNASSAGGGYNFTTHAGLKVAIDKNRLVGSISHTSGYIAMPQGGKLTNCQIEQIKSWITAGAANN